MLKGRLDLLQKLIDVGAEPEKCSSGYAQRFYDSWVITSCQFKGSQADEFFRILQTRGVDVPDVQELLFTVAAYGCHPAIPFVVAKGARLDVLDEGGLTPLHRASAVAGMQNIDTVRALIAFGADPNIPSRAGETALQSARRRLVNAGNWPLMEAAFDSERSR